MEEVQSFQTLYAEQIEHHAKRKENNHQPLYLPYKKLIEMDHILYS